MQELQFIKDYRNNELLRTSFFGLAADTFGLQLERWYQEGFWGERYIPFSYAAGEQIIANVSVNLLDLIIDGSSKKALQLGTVMTHPDYRQKGLSRALMNKVLEEYSGSCDFMYLFANETVLDFYPKFGFRPTQEQLFTASYQPQPPAEQGAVRKLSVSRAEDLAFVSAFAAQRQPVSQRFGTDSVHGSLMFYCMNVFSEDLYYLEDEEVIAICQQENNQLHIFDIISQGQVDIGSILSKLAGSSTTEIVFHFTPDYGGIEVEGVPYHSGLFVKSFSGEAFPALIKHPATSIT
jgi:predicted N-acetyltransferase YhbS